MPEWILPWIIIMLFSQDIKSEDPKDENGYQRTINPGYTTTIWPSCNDLTPALAIESTSESRSWIS